jgi:hypothetical protein
MRVFVESVGVLAPGLPDWAGACAVLAGEARYAAAPLAALAPQSLPAAERRRSSPVVRLALAAAEQALAACSRPAAELAMVFASLEASADITHQLCEVLARSGERAREVSPTQFHNSVHNAPSGYYSIAMHATAAAASVCRWQWTFAAGLLAAAGQVAADNEAVMYVCYDSPFPAPLSQHLAVTQPTAIALVLAPEPGARALGGWDIAVAPRAEPAFEPTLEPAWIPEAWQANASARGFAALATLAQAGAPRAALALSPQLELRISRC